MEREELIQASADFEDLCAMNLSTMNRYIAQGREASALWPVIELTADLAAEARRVEALD